MKLYRKSIENQSKIYRTSIENLSKIYRKSMKFYENLWKSMKIYENLWKSMALWGSCGLINSTHTFFQGFFKFQEARRILAKRKAHPEEASGRGYGEGHTSSHFGSLISTSRVQPGPPHPVEYLTPFRLIALQGAIVLCRIPRATI